MMSFWERSVVMSEMDLTRKRLEQMKIDFENGRVHRPTFNGRLS